MPINAHPDYLAAEKEYLQAQSLEEKIEKLKKMTSLAPSHKGAENLRAQLKTRLKKLISQLEKSKKSGKSKFKGIKKEDHQVVIVGYANSGKSSLLNLLTNARPKVSEVPYQTKQPKIGIIHIESVNFQLIENPAINSVYFDKGIANSADALLILVNKIEDIEKILKELEKSNAKKIIIFNSKKELNQNEKRIIRARLQSKKYNFVLVNLQEKIRGGNFKELKSKIFETFNKIRIYTKEPGREKAKKPMILNPNSTVKEAAEKILKGFSSNIKETKIWGPSSKFPGQYVGLKHKLKDLDVVEFKTR